MRCQFCGKQYMGVICPNCNRNATDFLPPPAPTFAANQNGERKRSRVWLVLVIILGIIIILFMALAVMRLLYSFGAARKPQEERQPMVTEYREKTGEERRAEERKKREEKGIYESGSYEVGKTLPEGIYRIDAQGAGNPIFELFSKPYDEKWTDTERRNAEILPDADVWRSKGEYVIVKKGQFVNTSWCSLIEIAKNPDDKVKPEKAKDSFVFLLVGHDIEPGQYEITGFSDTRSEYFTANQPFGSGYYQQSTKTLEKGQKKTITLYDGQILLLSYCTLHESDKAAPITGDISGQTGDIKVYESGTYTVGTDVPAGLYAIYSQSDVIGARLRQDGFEHSYGIQKIDNAFFVELSSGQKKIITPRWFQSNIYVELKDGQTLTFSHSSMTAAEVYYGTRDPFLQDGMFLVGKDLPAGTYKIACDKGHENDNWASYMILREPMTDLAEADAEGDIPKHLMSVTLKEGQYLQLEHCHLSDE